MFVLNHLNNGAQRTKICGAYSSWKDLLRGVSEGSTLEPRLFDAFINDIFWFVDETKIANFADDNTTNGVEKSIMTLLRILEEDTLGALKEIMTRFWFHVFLDAQNTQYLQAILKRVTPSWSISDIHSQRVSFIRM